MKKLLEKIEKKDDEPESPSCTTMQTLLDPGADLSYNDPHVPKLRPTRKHNFQMDSTPLSDELLAGMDAVIILTTHYDYDWIVENSYRVIDTRNATAGITNGKGNVVTA